MRRRVVIVVCAVLALWCGWPAAAGPAPAPGRTWPVTGTDGGRPRVVRGWEPPPVRWARGHRGVDLAAGPGAPVRAAAPGTVSFVGTIAGRGVVTVELTGTGDPPLRTTYEPVRAGVRRGETVAAGALLGELEPGPHHCPEGCLHWGLLRGREYLDPLRLLRHRPSRLLPLVGPPPARPFTVSRGRPRTPVRPPGGGPQAPDGLSHAPGREIQPARHLRTNAAEPRWGAGQAAWEAKSQPRRRARAEHVAGPGRSHVAGRGASRIGSPGHSRVGGPSGPH
ncbi:M23 family metallopeptidase [Streptomyces sp. AV19]|uniref:murein hydrolase activator EnvC family protein n=1 Tax=Streptomyces sp. AV19 TaxID=2793068 RepID=UPI0018FE3911|nr:M23 family metallopeptidase [Streptomyces sp. AV19]